MKRTGKRICTMMLSLFMSISMLFPTMVKVQAEEGYSQTKLTIEGTDYSIIFQYVDDHNNALTVADQKEITIKQGEVFYVDTLVKKLKGYIFKGAEDEILWTTFHAIAYDTNASHLVYQPRKDSTNWSEWPDFGENPKTKIVQLIYRGYTLTDLPTIEGSDTIQEGITMNLFDYNAEINGSNSINYNHTFRFVKGSSEGNTWNQGGQLRQGLVNNTLSNGYPVLNSEISNSESLAYLFDPAIEQSGKETYKNVNKLLQKTDDGYYVFDSKENFAIYDMHENEFVLSTEVGSPSQSGAGFNIGNFFPFNSIFSTNSYKTPNGKKVYNIVSPDFHFSMTLEANFLQPKDGIYQNQNMVFDFSGDDDVWVFIDDVLVLDLGGIHPAQAGSIDFASGNVIVNGKVSSTIRERFEKAKVNASFDGNTFADFTKHSIKFFYLERGAGASNCKLKINLPIMPKNGFAVSKDVSNVNDAVSLDDTFTFRAYVDTDNSGSYEDSELLRNTDYHIGNTTYQTNTDGTFTLKAGELAEFKQEWTENLSYKVEEINIESSRYQDVNMTSNHETVGSYDKEHGIASSGSLTIGQHVLVAFDNVLSDDQTSSLQIQKQVSEGTTSDEFQMITTIDGKLYQGDYTITDGTMTRNEIAKDGILTLKQNEIATIEKLPIHTSFAVEESLEQVHKDYQKYSTDVKYAFAKTENYDVANPSIKEGIAKGELTKNVAFLYVTNTPIFGNLQIIKNIDTANFANGDPIFTFKIERLNKEGDAVETQYRSVRFDNTLEAQSIRISHLPLGEYLVSELSSLRYQVEGEITSNETLEKADQTILFNFKNKVVYDQYYSHTDIILNHVEYKKDEQGNIIDVKISQDTLETVNE